MSWTVETVEVRIQSIKALPNSGETAKVPWLDTLTRFELKEVPISLLVYRVQNNRIRSALLEIESTDGQKIFANQEMQDVQDKLGKILLDYAKDKDGSGAADIFSVLKEEKTQSEPLVITASGVVVNGNRRLAAMRQLFEDNPTEFHSFKRVSCAVLPDNADEEQISEVETAYQTRRTVTQEYTWINEALLLERQMTEFHWTEQKVKKEWRLTIQKIKSKLAELRLVREYLNFLGKPNQFQLALGDKQSFVTLAVKNASWVASQVDPLVIRARLTLAWQIISHEGQGFNKYQYIQRIEGVTEGTLRRLLEQNPEDPQVALTENDADIFDYSAPTGVAVRDIDLRELEDPSDMDALMTWASQAQQEARLLGAENDRGNALQRAIDEALSTMQHAHVQGSFPQTHGSVLRKTVEVTTLAITVIASLLAGDPNLWQVIDDEGRSQFIELLEEISMQLSEIGYDASSEN